MPDKKFIEQSAAIAEIDEWLDYYIDSDIAQEALRLVRRYIKKIPAADVRPVVYCGECKHWFENGSDYCSCDRDALLRGRDFFCAAGEKREGS